MAHFVVLCPTCGDLHLRDHQLTVLVHKDCVRYSYAFQCPVCHKAVSQITSRQTADAMVSFGIRLDVVQPPEDPKENRSNAPPLTPKDLLDFHCQLEAADNVVGLMLGE